MPNISTVSFGPNGITANPISAGTSARIGAKAEQKLIRACRHDIFLEEEFQAIGDGLQNSIGPDFHWAHSILHPA